MAEKLTKTVLKDELRRRIKWYEDILHFNEEMTNDDLKDKGYISPIHFGRYRAYVDMLWQIENGYFKGGYVT